MNGITFVATDPIGLSDPVGKYHELCERADEFREERGRCGCRLVEIFTDVVVKSAILGANLYLYFNVSLNVNQMKAAVIRDLGQGMFRYLTETLQGREFAASLGYKSFEAVSLNDFLANFAKVQLDYCNGYCANTSCVSDISFYVNKDRIEYEFHAATSINMISTTAGVFFENFFKLRMNLSSAPLNEENNKKADRLLSRIDDFTKHHAEILSNEQLKKLRRKRCKVWRLQNRDRIVKLTMISSLFILNLGINLGFTLTAQVDIVNRFDPDLIYQPNRMQFCTEYGGACNPYLQPQNVSSDAKCVYPSNINEYLIQNSQISTADIKGKLWTSALFPLSAYIVPPLISYAIDKLFQCCMRPKKKDPFEDLESDY